MNKLCTSVQLSGQKHTLSYDDRFMNFGSCFATHMQQRLQNLKCQTSANPLGIVFNPASIARCLDILSGVEILDANRQSQGMYVNCDAHGDFSAVSEKELQTQLDHAIAQGREDLKDAQHLVMTFGTALIYESRDSGKVAANCHRLPANSFQQRQLSPDEIVALLAPHIEAHSDKQFLLSVSPIRHIRDGLQENSRSKAALLLALQILERDHANVVYIPSYEIMIDELRDYRYYARDMCHPSDLAVDIIWQRFRDHMFDDRSQKYFAELSIIIQASTHRPRNPEGEQHQNFCTQQLQRIEEFEQEYGARDFFAEKKQFSSH